METIFRHCIFIGSNYTSKKRKGLHFLVNEVNEADIKSIIKKFSNKKGVSIYMVVTEDTSIESVKEKEPFFKNIIIVEGAKKNEIEKFNKEVSNQIMAIDVLLLLLSQKAMNYDDAMLYLLGCYCEYISFKKTPPFPDKIKIGRDSFFVHNIEIDKLLKNKNRPKNYKLFCAHEEIIFSKFFNFEEENGAELMNDVLQIFYKLLNVDYYILQNKLLSFINEAFDYQKKTKEDKTNAGKPLLIGTVKSLYKTIL